ncbi:MAG: hypothetical protein ACRDSK_24050 [Actinophytocola sp.]|uniref:hypothetical protein n=1 Tax=Actinophytocola sp. TaxID=1872138 RepID=UPI003D69FF1E
MDSMWLSNTLLPALIAAAVLLLVLWPTKQSGRRLLRNWGLAEPTEQQIAVAVRYLWQRRILYVVLIVALPPAVSLVLPAVDNNPWPANIVVLLLAAMLIAELVAVVRPVRGVRVASLDPRGWRDLVPRWAVVVLAGLASVVVALVVLGLAAQPWADRYAAELPAGGSREAVESDLGTQTRLVEPTGWATLAGVVVCLAVVAVVVLLAVRRPAVADPAVDAALRTRTARVAVGIGMGWLAGLVFEAQSRLGFLLTAGAGVGRVPDRPGWLDSGLGPIYDILGFAVFVVAVGCWLLVAAPSRGALARSGR